MASNSEENTVYLITGASRGIGHALLLRLLQRPHTTVIAATRAPPNSPTSSALLALPRHETSRALAVQIDSRSETDASTAAAQLQAAGIRSIDVVVAAAGMVDSLQRIADTDVGQVLAHVDVNCGGVLGLVKGLGGLIGFGDGGGGGGGSDGADGKEKERKFVVVSSSVGSIGEMLPVPGLAYGVSKAAVNFLTRKLSDEWAGCSVAVHPGWVKTEMGNYAAKAWGEDEAPMELDFCADSMLKLIDGLTREKDGGKFLRYDGVPVAW